MENVADKPATKVDWPAVLVIETSLNIRTSTATEVSVELKRIE